jgi:hypothetical protein
MKTILFTALVFCVASSAICAGEAVGIDPMTAKHTEAMTDFVNLLRADEMKTAVDRWGSADSKLDEYWKILRECDAKFDYTNWITGKFKPAGDETKFTVGGHSYGHMHIEWQATRQGWRIVKVWMCR